MIVFLSKPQFECFSSLRFLSEFRVLVLAGQMCNYGATNMLINQRVLNVSGSNENFLFFSTQSVFANDIFSV